MSSSYIGEIRMWPCQRAPVDWHFCDGRLLNISQYTSLLIGTTYGGDGSSTFGLPDLRSRVPIHVGQGTGQPYSLGTQGGSETVTLTAQQLPSHNHVFSASASADRSTPASASLGSPGSPNIYVAGAPTSAMAGTSISSAGYGSPHDNMMPFVVVNFIISLSAQDPSQS